MLRFAILGLVVCCCPAVALASNPGGMGTTSEKTPARVRPGVIAIGMTEDQVAEVLPRQFWLIGRPWGELNWIFDTSAGKKIYFSKGRVTFISK